ncbi:MAG: pyridoxal-phosphate dependent enzyme, partial [Chloroflexi bacterium]|nr:pyridoxal-phosphate dependent enzyme [Chloroflexota bacterium]
MGIHRWRRPNQHWPIRPRTRLMHPRRPSHAHRLWPQRRRLATQPETNMNNQTILDRIAELPRIKLARLCTPFEEAARLRTAIAESMDADVDAVPRIFIKRDDATGFAFGGNKARHMEFLFAHLIERGFDTVVNINHYHSNQARFVAASCAKMDMRCHMVAVDMVDAPVIGNLLIGHLTGAEIHRIPGEYSREVAEKLVADENDAGRNATILSDNDFSDIAGMIGFVETGVELSAQTEDAGVGDVPLRMWGLVGRSIAGLRLYARNTGKNWTASATAYSHTQPDSYEAVYIDRSTRVAELLGLDTALEPNDLDTIIGYTGDDYGIPTEGVFEAIHLVAKTEGIILDPNYTGKSMSALIGEIRAGNVDPDVPVVFV